MDALPPPSSLLPIADIQKLQSTIPLQLSRFNAQIARLNRLLASTPALDTLLCTTTYTLTLISALLPPSIPLKSKVSLSTSSRLTRLRTSLPPLIHILSDLRITLRLWSLLSIYTSAISTLSSPPSDRLLRWIAYAQVVASTAFQVLENGAHLGDKGVLAVSDVSRGKWWLWSGRAWMLSTALEGGRLGREWALARRRREMGTEENEGGGDGDGEKEGKIARGEEVRRWWSEVGVNAAYAPMTLHWSLEQGLLTDGIIGALGMVAGGLGLREAWRRTA